VYNLLDALVKSIQMIILKYDMMKYLCHVCLLKLLFFGKGIESFSIEYDIDTK